MLIKDNSFWYSGSHGREFAANRADPNGYYRHHFNSGDNAIAVMLVVLAVCALVLGALLHPLWLMGMLPALAGAYFSRRHGKLAVSQYDEVNQHLTAINTRMPWRDGGAWGLLHRHLYSRYIRLYDIRPREEYRWHDPREHYWEMVERHRDTVNGFLANKMVANGLEIVSDPDTSCGTKAATENALDVFAEKVVDDIWAIESERHQLNSATIDVMATFTVADLKLEAANEPPALS